MIRLIAALCILCAVSLQSQPKPAPSPLAQKALAAREAGRLPESIDLYRKALATRPADAESWWYQGLNFYDTDQFPQCEDAFGRLAKLNPRYGPAFAFLGLCEFRTGKLKESFVHIVQGKSLGLPVGNPLDQVAQFHYIQLLNKFGQFEAAAGPLTDIARGAPETPGLRELAGVNALRLPLLPREVPADKQEPVQIAGEAALKAWQRQYPAARTAAESLLAKYPTLPNTHYLMGWLCLLEQKECSIPMFQDEIRISPKHVQARLQIAYEFLQRGETANGLPYAKEAAALAPDDFMARDIYGRLLLLENKPADAIRELELAVKLAPSSPDAHFHLAAAYTRAGRKADADRHRAIFSELDKARQARPVPGVKPLAVKPAQ